MVNSAMRYKDVDLPIIHDHSKISVNLNNLIREKKKKIIDGVSLGGFT